MLKTLLVLCGALVVSATGLQAQGVRSAAAYSSLFRGRVRPDLAARPAAYRGGSRYGGFVLRPSSRQLWPLLLLGRRPVFLPVRLRVRLPVLRRYGGFGDGYGYGYGAYPGNGAAYNGRIDDNDSGRQAGGSLPEAVQRQLAKRGYYKGPWMASLVRPAAAP